MLMHDQCNKIAKHSTEIVSTGWYGQTRRRRDRVYIRRAIQPSLMSLRSIGVVVSVIIGDSRPSPPGEP